MIESLAGTVKKTKEKKKKKKEKRKTATTKQNGNAKSIGHIHAVNIYATVNV